MTTIVTRLGKGSALTWLEGDTNFENLNNFKVETTTLAGAGWSDLVGYNQGGTGAITRTLQDTLRERMVNVMDFGALGDGTTDDGPAIQNAINSLLVSSSLGGGIVFFPKPAVNYAIGTAVDLSNITNLTLLGVGGVEFNPLGTQSHIKAKSGFTGPMFTTDTSSPYPRSGGVVFENLLLDGNNQNVTAYYIHASSGSGSQARMLEFTGCAFINFQTGLWLGDYSNENPDFTYLLGVNLYRCYFVDCVYPIICDAASFDGFDLEQVVIANENDKTIRAIQILLNGQTTTMKSVWFDLGPAATYGVYSTLPNPLIMENCAFEGHTGAETFVSVYQGGGGASLSGVILDNIRIQSVAGATAISVDNPNGMSIRNSTVDGNIVIGASCITHADGVNFSAGGYTGTTANVYVNGTASGTWTPTLTFETPGDLAVTYTIRVGSYTKVGRQVTVHFELATSAFTYMTASGNLQVTGLPYPISATYSPSGSLSAYSGITDATTPFVGVLGVPSSSLMTFGRSGSGVAQAAVTEIEVPSAGTVVLYGSLTYTTDTV